jgi:DNA (cytosine-5)-methyltransferase 1
LLEEDVDEKYFLNEGFINNYVLAKEDRWNRKPEVNKPIASTLTTRMGTLRAEQDNYQSINGRLRKLTPREGLRLMGYGDDFKMVCSNTQLYKQIGNSIVVDVIGGVLRQVISKL